MKTEQEIKDKINTIRSQLEHYINLRMEEKINEGKLFQEFIDSNKDQKLDIVFSQLINELIKQNEKNNNEDVKSFLLSRNLEIYMLEWVLEDENSN